MCRCKFCGVAEGGLDRRGAAAHINRDNLCNACYQLLRAVREHKAISPEDTTWFNKMCELNLSIGRFVPVAQRRQLRASKPWQCHRCGSFKEFMADEHYKNYCMACADTIRHERELGPRTKQRSDKGGKHQCARYGIPVVDTKQRGGSNA